ncbi:AraC family transcriptional regulator [Streptomyces flavofungini]|uniref:AraC family transcriptional regulator n=1 Tax=Streptomyces flavofungini TaxID=68200 RepID=A0ABS0XIW6_9ACTN|nr:AraC family transcriptional regulator [Streptomyces flavofungini]MBJ3813175.1 AraC family transcriptional regulator [Streptomyces flavofungini]GHC40499.1 AraC family transcriptional regulator [Streptomyces flavofungini]
MAHTKQAFTPADRAIWTRAPLGTDTTLDLLTARFDRHRYAPHYHEEFTVGVCVGGSEIIDYRGGRLDVGPGAVVVLAPGETHTGRPGPGGGYAYRAMYPAVHLFADGARALPHFRQAVLDDPQLAAALRAAHTGLSRAPARGAEILDPAADVPDLLTALAAETRLTELFAALARRHAEARPLRAGDRGREGTAVPGTTAIARTVRDRLADSVLAPPTLTELATELGLSRYQLLRAFRTTTGMPPYAWLAQYRVGRARGLLERGLRPAAVAGLVGFADQAHLTRWFRRVVGVTPAAYRDSVRAATAPTRRDEAGPATATTFKT